MDQRVKGGTPPVTNLTLDPSPATEEAEHDQIAEKRSRCEGENTGGGKKEEEKKATARKREGDKGAVLELLIEGRCGSSGQQQLHISGRDTGCPEGNVRLRIGLQEKRTKKPPKILESYVCKPTIRTYQRQGRGAVLKGDNEGRVGQQTKPSSSRDDTTGEQHLGLDFTQTTSKQSASVAPPQPSVSSPASSSPSSLQQLSLSPTSASASTPTLVPAIASQGTKSAKQVPIKLADKTEVNSNGSTARLKKGKLPGVNGQPVPAGHKSCPSSSDKAASTTSSTPCIQALSALETSNESKTTTKHNGFVRTARQKGLSNGKGCVDILGTTSKIKAGKHSSPSSISSKDSTIPCHNETSLSKKGSPCSPSSPSVPPKPQSTPNVGQSQEKSPCLQPSLERKREKEKKTKKEKRKDKKSKRNKLEAEKQKSENKQEEDKKTKGEKGKDEKPRHGKEKAESHRTDDRCGGEVNSERGKAEKKKDKPSLNRQRTEDKNPKYGETLACATQDNICTVLSPGRPEENDETGDSCSPVKKAEPIASTGDTIKSKDPDNSRHSTVPPSQPSCSAPPSLPTPSARAPVFPPSFPQEQDSRPLKKRKARRPSWTKLVHRAHRSENHETPSDSQHSPVVSSSQNPKTSHPANACFQQTDDAHPVSSSLSSNTTPHSSASKPPSPKQPMLEPSPPVSRSPLTSTRKRGRPKSLSSSLEEPPPRLSLNTNPVEEPALGCNVVQKAPVLEPSPRMQCASQTKYSPKKRGRPPKRPLPDDQIRAAPNHSDHTDRDKDYHISDNGNKQLKIRKLINEMKKRKKKRLNKAIVSGYVGKEGRGGEGADGETSLRMCKSIEATTVQALSALSSSFGSKLGPQINVSKRGTIYMGKRRGRKPKAQTANLNTNAQSSTQSSFLSNPSETSFFSSNQPHPPPSHPFPSPSLTHSSGAHSPRSEGSITEPTSSLLFPHHFSLPSPSSSCTSPRPPSSSSLSPFVKKTCPCQGRHHFPFHQSSCKLSGPIPPLHHTAGSPNHIKDATPSPRSESHSEETLPSDSGIGTDNNSVSERAEMRGARGILRLGHGSGAVLGHRQPSLVDHHSPVSSPSSHPIRHTNLISGSSNVERHRDRHRHRRRDYDCSPSCSCLCPCSGHNKCTHSEYYPCLGHNALKRQKNKHKKKHQQLHMQDPEFLAELEDLIGQFNEIHIGKRSWMRATVGQGFDGSAGGRRHHSSPHSLRSNIFRINLNGFYSPHPSSYPTNPAFSPQPFFPCQPLHCNRKPERRQCGCPSKFQETIENMGFYGSYPQPPTLFHHHLPSSYQLPPSHQFAPHQPQHAHYLLNPARFHRRRSRLLREGALGEVEGDMGGVSGGGQHLSAGFTSSLACGCGRKEHKHKHRHRHCDRDLDDEEELHGEEDDDGLDREGLVSSKHRSGLILGQGDGGKKGTKGMGSSLSKESPWLCQNGNGSYSAAAASSSSSLSSSAHKYKHMPLTSLGLGSSHLTSFGGSWGALGQSRIRFGSLGGPEFGNSNPSWRGFTKEQHPGRMAASDGEDKDAEDAEESYLCRRSPSPLHTNLFTSAMAAGGKGSRSGLTGRNLRYVENEERSWRREEPAWRDRRESGTVDLQGDSRGRGQQKSVPAPESAAVKGKRRPGRPRKHPLPFTASSPTHLTTAPSVSALELLPGHHNHNIDGKEVAGGRKEGGRAAERDRGDPVQQVTESELQVGKKRGRKRKHSNSPCHQSVTVALPECDTVQECFSHSDVEQAPSQTAVDQSAERDDCPPCKPYLKAGLYSDDYKTMDAPCRAQQKCRESLEYSPGEQEYTLLPAPTHVGKYLRLKRIHFQLPYDVLWLWQHNQLHRQPAVPLKRKRRYCRLKDRSVSSHQTAEESCSDIASLLPHLDMDPLTSSERSFVVTHRVFLVRNWELMRDRQIRLRIERERERYADEEKRDSRRSSWDGANGDDGHIKSDQQVGVEVTVISSNPLRQNQDTSSLLTASPFPNRGQNRGGGEEGQKGKGGEEEVCDREQRRRRLNDLLLTLQHL